MTQRSSVESPSSASTPLTPLHPVVQATLENLDVQIEEELMRYRRYRQFATQDWRQKVPAHHPVAAIECAATDAPAWLSGAVSSAATATPSAATAIYPTATTQPQATSSGGEGMQQPSLQSIASSQRSPQAQAQAQVQAHTQAQTIPQAKAIAEPTRPANSGSAPVFTPSEPSSAESLSFDSDQWFSANTEVDRSVQLEREPSLLDTLLTPLGVGSMLLLLLSSASLGFAIMNPASVSGILARFGRPNQQAIETSIGASDPTTPAANANAFATDSFVPGLTLSNLSLIPSGSRRGQFPAVPGAIAAQSSPTAGTNSSVTTGSAPGSALTPNRFAAAIGERNISTVPISSAFPAPAYNPPPAEPPAVSYSAAPVYVPPAPAAAPAAPAAAPRPQSPPARSTATAPATPKPELAPIPTEPPAIAAIEPPAPTATSLDRAYHVDTRYLGDPSLEQARQVAPEANVYNGNDGANIRLGSFATEAEASQYAQQLEQQGIEAQIKAGD